MTDRDELSALRAEVDELRRRIARFEAKEACLSTFNNYLYLMDVGYPDELVRRVFTPDAVLEVVNFPPGTMQDLHLTGYDEISPLYTDHTQWAPAIQGGHHSSNLAVDVSHDLRTAHLSAYFMTSSSGASLQGGMYQGELVPSGEPGQWRFRRYRILSGWGWRVPKDDRTVITGSVSADRAWRGARPASYTPWPS